MYKWTNNDSMFFNVMALVTATGVQYKPVISQVVDCTIEQAHITGKNNPYSRSTMARQSFESSH